MTYTCLFIAGSKAKFLVGIWANIVAIYDQNQYKNIDAVEVNMNCQNGVLVSKKIFDGFEMTGDCRHTSSDLLTTTLIH